MRKPRDFDSELRALNDKTRQLRARKVQQLGELVMACGAGELSIEQLAGALIAATTADTSTREVWRQSGAAFFRKERAGSGSTQRDDRRAPPRDGAAPSGSGDNGA